MSATLAFLGQFGDAVEFIVDGRTSPEGLHQGGSQFLELTKDHMVLSVAATATACGVAIPLGLVLGHTGRGGFLAISLSNVGRAVPSLALIAFFVAFLSVGFANVMTALALLAIPPILTNTYVAVRQVDPETVDAARGMGMSGAEIVGRVELPLALPLVFGGVKTSMVNVVATATIAPLAGVESLGDPIINPSVYSSAGQLGAAILVALLAVVTELSLSAMQRGVTPRGLKLDTRRVRFPIQLTRRARAIP